MASQDALKLLRQAIAAGQHPITTTSADAASASDAEPDLSKATHLQITHLSPPVVFALNSPTRFVSTSSGSPTPIDLRSIYAAWLKKDLPITDYINSCQALNADLKAAGIEEEIKNLVFAEKLELITWLEGASDESEFIQPLEGEEKDYRDAQSAAGVASGATGGIDRKGPSAGLGGKRIDQRMRDIYNGERRMGDRNTILRGVKPTDFSHVRKHAEAFLGRNRKVASKVSAAPGVPQTLSNLPTGRNKPGHALQPIILLSPSASSLLRMSNIKAFLESGIYERPESGAANLLNVQRMMPSINPSRPLRFILVDNPDQFRPDYWNRVAAVFTTGQTWQFKAYKWQSPPDLFSHALGIFVGWRGEEIPSAVLGWGRGVMSAQIDKYNANQGPQARWRDREVVEGIWTAIEESMKVKGWGKEVR